MENLLAVVAILIALVIGVWQIRLARQQLRSGKTDKETQYPGEEIVSEPTGTDTHLLITIWAKLDPDLQDALSIAYNQAQRDGVNAIKTRYLFAALSRLRPYPLSELLERFPDDALPSPADAEIKPDNRIIEHNPRLSACVEDSLYQLDRITDSERTISATDLFVDIVRHGTGESVARLRTHGVTPEKVDSIIRQVGWSVLARVN